MNEVSVTSSSDVSEIGSLLNFDLAGDFRLLRLFSWLEPNLEYRFLRASVVLLGTCNAEIVVQLVPCERVSWRSRLS